MSYEKLREKTIFWQSERLKDIQSYARRSSLKNQPKVKNNSLIHTPLNFCFHALVNVHLKININHMTVFLLMNDW